MQTYKPILIETSVATALSLAVAALFAPADLGLTTLYPHPVWLAVAVVAARYGSRGLSVGIPLSWGALTLAALLMRISPAEVLARTSSGGDLGALIGVVLVGAVASIHERRYELMLHTVETLKERCAGDRSAVKELREAAVVLRARADRLETSLAFLRDAAARLEGSDPTAAAQAALELAVARIGARAGTAQVVQHGILRGVASIGAWAPDAGASDLTRDQTVAMAMRNRRPTRAFDLSDVSVSDSDLAAPIFDARGNVCGILALRGVPHGGASAVALHDLALIAAWCAKAFAGAREDDLRAAHDEDRPKLAQAVPLIPSHAPGPAADRDDDRNPGLADRLTPPPRSISQINV